MSRIEHLGTVTLPAIRIRKERYRDTGLVVTQEPATLHLPALETAARDGRGRGQAGTGVGREETKEEIDAWFDAHLARADARQGHTKQSSTVTGESESESDLLLF